MHSINSAIRITVTTKRDLTAATVLRIDYTKPDGTTGSWTGTLTDGQRIVYEASATDIDQPGPWKFKAYAEIGGKPYRPKQPYTEIFK
jgi:hypothetical protein